MTTRPGFIIELLLQKRRDPELLCLILAIVLLIIAFIKPSVIVERASYRYVMVFDITQSMNVADADQLATTRLEFAKRTFIETLDELPCTAEIGLALFTGHRAFLLFTPVSICTHYDELIEMITALDWRMAWEARSEVAKGLYKSIDLIHKLDADIRLVFITDGHEAPPIHPVYHPQFRGEPGRIKGLIVGVGGLVPVPIPKLDYDGNLLGYWAANEVMQVDTYSLGRGTNVANDTLAGVDSGNVQQRIASGSEHLSRLQEKYLQQLADISGLGYMRLDHAEQLARQLQTAHLAESKPQPTDVRWICAMVALVLLLLVQLRPAWKQRP